MFTYQRPKYETKSNQLQNSHLESNITFFICSTECVLQAKPVSLCPFKKKLAKQKGMWGSMEKATADMTNTKEDSDTISG